MCVCVCVCVFVGVRVRVRVCVCLVSVYYGRNMPHSIHNIEFTEKQQYLLSKPHFLIS